MNPIIPKLKNIKGVLQRQMPGLQFLKMLISSFLFVFLLMVVPISSVNLERLKDGNVVLCRKWHLLLVLNITK